MDLYEDFGREIYICSLELENYMLVGTISDFTHHCIANPQPLPSISLMLCKYVLIELTLNFFVVV